MSTSSNFLEVENPLKSLADELNFFNLDTGSPPRDFKKITPIPGFCVKAKTESNEKLFINVCHSSEVPPPPESYFDLNEVLAGAEESLFRFPLSLGEVHHEVDKTGNTCKCHDVVINSQYFEAVSRSTGLRDFVTTLAVSGLEQKTGVGIDVGSCTVLNKKYHGSMPAHFIKLAPAGGDPGPIPLEGGGLPETEEIVMPVKNPVPFTDPKVPSFRLFRYPASGRPELVIFQGLTRDAKDRACLRVFVSRQQLALRTAKGKVVMNVNLPLPVVPELAMANFCLNRVVVAMPILEEQG